MARQAYAGFDPAMVLNAARARQGEGLSRQAIHDMGLSYGLTDDETSGILDQLTWAPEFRDTLRWDATVGEGGDFAIHSAADQQREWQAEQDRRNALNPVQRQMEDLERQWDQEGANSEGGVRTGVNTGIINIDGQDYMASSTAGGGQTIHRTSDVQPDNLPKGTRLIDMYNPETGEVTQQLQQKSKGALVDGIGAVSQMPGVAMALNSIVPGLGSALQAAGAASRGDWGSAIAGGLGAAGGAGFIDPSYGQYANIANQASKGNWLGAAMGAGNAMGGLGGLSNALGGGGAQSDVFSNQELEAGDFGNNWEDWNSFQPGADWQNTYDQASYDDQLSGMTDGSGSFGGLDGQGNTSIGSDGQQIQGYGDMQGYDTDNWNNTGVGANIGDPNSLGGYDELEQFDDLQTDLGGNNAQGGGNQILTDESGSAYFAPSGDGQWNFDDETGEYVLSRGDDGPGGFEAQVDNDGYYQDEAGDDLRVGQGGDWSSGGGGDIFFDENGIAQVHGVGGAQMPSTPPANVTRDPERVRPSGGGQGPGLGGLAGLGMQMLGGMGGRGGRGGRSGGTPEPKGWAQPPAGGKQPPAGGQQGPGSGSVNPDISGVNLSQGLGNNQQIAQGNPAGNFAVPQAQAGASPYDAIKSQDWSAMAKNPFMAPGQAGSKTGTGTGIGSVAGGNAAPSSFSWTGAMNAASPSAAATQAMPTAKAEGGMIGLMEDLVMNRLTQNKAMGGLAGFSGGGMMHDRHPNGEVMFMSEGGERNYVQGPGTGQSDEVPAMLANGEYVIDADIVAALGDGSNEAGAQALDNWRQQIRAHKRGGGLADIPPKSLGPDQYFNMAMGGQANGYI